MATIISSFSDEVLISQYVVGMDCYVHSKMLYERVRGCGLGRSILV